MREYAGSQRYDATGTVQPVARRPSYSPVRRREERSPMSPRSHSRENGSPGPPLHPPFEEYEDPARRGGRPRSTSDQESFHSQSPPGSRTTSPPRSKGNIRQPRSPGTPLASSPSREVTLLDDRTLTDPRRRRPSDLKDLVVRVSDVRRPPESPHRLSCNKGHKGHSDLDGEDLPNNIGGLIRNEPQDPRLQTRRIMDDQVSSGDERSVDGDRNSKKQRYIDGIYEKAAAVKRIPDPTESRPRDTSPNFRRPYDTRKLVDGKIRRDNFRFDEQARSPQSDPRNRKTSSGGSDVEDLANWRAREQPPVSSSCDSADFGSDGSPPGTPVRDERDEPLPSAEVPRLLSHQQNHFISPRERPVNSPMFLPLPRFAYRIHLSPRATSMSPKGGGLIKSPPFNCVNNWPTNNEITNKILEDESSVAETPMSPGPALHDSLSDVEDSPLASPTTAAMDLEERIKALEERYEKWTGTSRVSNGPGPVNTIISNGPTNCVTGRNSRKKRILDLEELCSRPSAIVRSVLSKRSVFDEDSERLENVSDKYEPKPFSSVARTRGNTVVLSHLMTTNASNSSSLVIPTTTAPIPSATPISSLPGVRSSCFENLQPPKVSCISQPIKCRSSPLSDHPGGSLNSNLPSNINESGGSSVNSISGIPLPNIDRGSLTSSLLPNASHVLVSSPISSPDVSPCHNPFNLNSTTSSSIPSTILTTTTVDSSSHSLEQPVTTENSENLNIISETKEKEETIQDAKVFSESESVIPGSSMTSSERAMTSDEPFLTSEGSSSSGLPTAIHSKSGSKENNPASTVQENRSKNIANNNNNNNDSEVTVLMNHIGTKHKKEQQSLVPETNVTTNSLDVNVCPLSGVLNYRLSETKAKDLLNEQQNICVNNVNLVNSVNDQKDGKIGLSSPDFDGSTGPEMEIDLRDDRKRKNGMTDRSRLDLERKSERETFVPDREVKSEPERKKMKMDVNESDSELRVEKTDERKTLDEVRKSEKKHHIRNNCKEENYENYSHHHQVVGRTFDLFEVRQKKLRASSKYKKDLDKDRISQRSKDKLKEKLEDKYSHKDKLLCDIRNKLDFHIKEEQEERYNNCDEIKTECPLDISDVSTENAEDIPYKRSINDLGSTHNKDSFRGISRENHNYKELIKENLIIKEEVDVYREDHVFEKKELRFEEKRERNDYCNKDQSKSDKRDLHRSFKENRSDLYKDKEINHVSNYARDEKLEFYKEDRKDYKSNKKDEVRKEQSCDKKEERKDRNSRDDKKEHSKDKKDEKYEKRSGLKEDKRNHARDEWREHYRSETSEINERNADEDTNPLEMEMEHKIQTDYIVEKSYALEIRNENHEERKERREKKEKIKDKVRDQRKERNKEEKRERIKEDWNYEKKYEDYEEEYKNEDLKKDKEEKDKIYRKKDEIKDFKGDSSREFKTEKLDWDLDESDKEERREKSRNRKVDKEEKRESKRREKFEFDKKEEREEKKIPKLKADHDRRRYSEDSKVKDEKRERHKEKKNKSKERHKSSNSSKSENENRSREKSRSSDKCRDKSKDKMKYFKTLIKDEENNQYRCSMDRETLSDIPSNHNRSKFDNEHFNRYKLSHGELPEKSITNSHIQDISDTEMDICPPIRNSSPISVDSVHEKISFSEEKLDCVRKKHDSGKSDKSEVDQRSKISKSSKRKSSQDELMDETIDTPEKSTFSSDDESSTAKHQPAKRCKQRATSSSSGSRRGRPPKKSILDTDSEIGDSDSESEGEANIQKESYFDVPVYDAGFDMYDKVKARRFKLQQKQEEEKRQLEAKQKLLQQYKQQQNRKKQKKSSNNSTRNSTTTISESEDSGTELEPIKRNSGRVLQSSSEDDVLTKRRSSQFSDSDSSPHMQKLEKNKKLSNRKKESKNKTKSRFSVAVSDITSDEDDLVISRDVTNVSDSDSEPHNNKVMNKIDSDSEISEAGIPKPPRPALSAGPSKLREKDRKLSKSRDKPRKDHGRDLFVSNNEGVSGRWDDSRHIKPKLKAEAMEVNRSVASTNYHRISQRERKRTGESTPKERRKEGKLEAIFGHMSDDSDSSASPNASRGASRIILAPSRRNLSTSSSGSPAPHILSSPDNHNLTSNNYESELDDVTHDDRVYSMQNHVSEDSDIKNIINKNNNILSDLSHDLKEEAKVKHELLPEFCSKNRLEQPPLTVMKQMDIPDICRITTDSGKGSSARSSSEISNSSCSSTEEILQFELANKVDTLVKEEVKDTLIKKESSLFEEKLRHNTEIPTEPLIYKDKKKKKNKKDKDFTKSKSKDHFSSSTKNSTHSEHYNNKYNSSSNTTNIETICSFKEEPTPAKENTNASLNAICINKKSMPTLQAPENCNLENEKSALPNDSNKSLPDLDMPIIKPEDTDDDHVKAMIDQDKNNKVSLNLDKLKSDPETAVRSISSTPRRSVLAVDDESNFDGNTTTDPNEFDDEANNGQTNSSKASRAVISQEETLNAVAGLLACYDEYPDEEEQPAPTADEESLMSTENPSASDDVSEEAQKAAQMLQSEMPGVDREPDEREDNWTSVESLTNTLPIQSPSQTPAEDVQDEHEGETETGNSALQFTDSPASVQSEPALQIDEDLPDATEDTPSVSYDLEKTNSPPETIAGETATTETKNLWSVLDERSNLTEEKSKPDNKDPLDTEKVKVCNKSNEQNIKMKEVTNSNDLNKKAVSEVSREENVSAEDKVIDKINYDKAHQMDNDIPKENPVLESLSLMKSEENKVSVTSADDESGCSMLGSKSTSKDETSLKVSEHSIESSSLTKNKEQEKTNEIVKTNEVKTEISENLETTTSVLGTGFVESKTNDQTDDINSLKEEKPLDTSDISKNLKPEEDENKTQNDLDEVKSANLETKKEEVILTEIDKNLIKPHEDVKDTAKVCEVDSENSELSVEQKKIPTDEKSENLDQENMMDVSLNHSHENLNNEMDIKKFENEEIDSELDTVIPVITNRGRGRGRVRCNRRGIKRNNDVILTDKDKHGVVGTRSSISTRAQKGRGRGTRTTRSNDLSVEEKSVIEAPPEPRRSARTKRARRHPDMVDHDETTNRRRRGGGRGKTLNVEESTLSNPSQTSTPSVYDFHESEDEDDINIGLSKNKVKKESPRSVAPVESNAPKPIQIVQNNPKTPVKLVQLETEQEETKTIVTRKSRRLLDKVTDDDDESNGDLPLPPITRGRGRNKTKEIDVEDENSVPRKSPRGRARQSSECESEPDKVTLHDTLTVITTTCSSTVSPASPKPVMSITPTSVESSTTSSTSTMTTPTSSVISASFVTVTSSVNTVVDTTPVASKVTSIAQQAPISISTVLESTTITPTVVSTASLSSQTTTTTPTSVPSLEIIPTTVSVPPVVSHAVPSSSSMDTSVISSVVSTTILTKPTIKSVPVVTVTATGKPPLVVETNEMRPTPLVDPVTGLLTPMKMGEEGQYVPIAGEAPGSSNASLILHDHALAKLSPAQLQHVSVSQALLQQKQQKIVQLKQVVSQASTQMAIQTKVKSPISTIPVSVQRRPPSVSVLSSTTPQSLTSVTGSTNNGTNRVVTMTPSNPNMLGINVAARMSEVSVELVTRPRGTTPSSVSTRNLQGALPLPCGRAPTIPNQVTTTRLPTHTPVTPRMSIPVSMSSVPGRSSASVQQQVTVSRGLAVSQVGNIRPTITTQQLSHSHLARGITKTAVPVQQKTATQHRSPHGNTNCSKVSVIKSNLTFCVNY